MFKTLIFFCQLLKTSIRASVSRRKAFLIESALMIANNLIFFSIWWIFFRQFNDISGWTLNELTLLMAVGIGSYGLSQIAFGGIRSLSKMIINGDIDPFMTQPKSLLLHIAGSKSLSKGWGHMMTTMILIFFGGFYKPFFLFLIAISILCGCLIFVSAGIIAHSLPFWLGTVDSLSKKYCDALFLFALYPTNIYSGMVQILMFTLIPAGIISYLPVELISNFSWLKFSLLLASSMAFFSLANCIFYAGLKKYESGNRFGMRL